MIDLSGLTESDSVRFWAFVATGDDDECWPWIGTAKAKGYGRFYYRNSRVAAHRVAWALTHGDPGALEVDHLCRHVDCCNPKHLEAVSADENRKRRINFYRPTIQGRDE